MRGITPKQLGWGTLAINPAQTEQLPACGELAWERLPEEQSSAVQAPPLSRQRLREEPADTRTWGQLGSRPREPRLLSHQLCLTLWPRELQHARLLAPRTPWTQWKGKRPTALWKLMGVLEELTGEAVWDSPALESTSEAAPWEAPSLHVKGLLILKHCPEGQGLGGNRRREVAGHHLPSRLCLAKAGGNHLSFFLYQWYHLHPSTLLQSASNPRWELLGSMISKPGQMNLPNQSSNNKKTTRKKLYIA